MRTITVTVSTDKVGSLCSDTFEVDDDATDEFIEAEAREVMFNMIEWNWR